MQVIYETGREGVAGVFVGQFSDGCLAELVESWEPGISHEEKWVLIISSLVGCPFRCAFCDAGGGYERCLSLQELLDQVLYLVSRRYPDLNIPVTKFKIQFARVGEPSLNPDILSLLEILPEKLDAPGLLPCLSTIAPKQAGAFFKNLADIKNLHYPGGKFQLQFSVHSTDDSFRKTIMTPGVWPLKKIAAFADTWFRPGDRKITLNFALGEDFPFETEVLKNNFDPGRFLVKITPINPTSRKDEGGFRSIYPGPGEDFLEKVRILRQAGFTVLESIGNLEENDIGSNCGQYLQRLSDI